VRKDPSTSTSTFTVGDAVQTPLGKGIVREVRKNSRLSIEVSGRFVVLEEHVVAPLATRKTSARKKEPAPAAEPVPGARPRGGHRAPTEVDLHGLTVEAALARAETALNDALLADIAELRLIHGQSGGRIRGALHRWLRNVPSIRAFRLDPRNAGVTIVSL
jgi:dsDNA-specific endonuclease/ATPase MutS2